MEEPQTSKPKVLSTDEHDPATRAEGLYLPNGEEGWGEFAIALILAIQAEELTNISK